jgi:UDP-2,4-diacetamido-2,4,6-trideoxy-beta-L-altropyranose hydrolase
MSGSAGDAETTGTCARELGAAWVVVDGYQFGADYQRRLKDAGLRVLFFDDYGHAGDYCADLVLNQNLGADAAHYATRASHTRLLLGTRYVLLRREFLAWRGWQREIPPVARRILVTMGGGDLDNVTGRVAEVLRSLNLEARVVVGGSNPHLAALTAAVRHPSCVIHDARNMPELMAWADVAVTAGGSTSWELAFMGLPSLILVLAHNQEAAANALSRQHVAINLGWQTHLAEQELVARLSEVIHSAALRRTLSQQGRQLVDGLGARHVVEALLYVTSGSCANHQTTDFKPSAG